MNYSLEMYTYHDRLFATSVYIYTHIRVCLTLAVPYFLLAIPKHFVTHIIWSQPLFAGDAGS